MDQKPYQKNIITREAALYLLDEVDRIRREEKEKHRGHDFSCRAIAAIIAHAGGFTDGRAEWTGVLKADPRTYYAQDLKEQGAAFNG